MNLKNRYSLRFQMNRWNLMFLMNLMNLKYH
jgi:hypothetical protein